MTSGENLSPGEINCLRPLFSPFFDLEVRRATTVLHYWRWGMWTALVMWLAIYGYFIASMALGWEGLRLSGLATGLGINVVLFPLMGLYGWWSCRKARARLLRFGRLRAQLAP